MGASQIMNFIEWVNLFIEYSSSFSVFDTQVIGFKAPSIFFKDSCKSGFPKKSQNNLSRKKRCLSKIMQFRGGEEGGGGAVYL